MSHGVSDSIKKALNAGKKVLAVTRLEKYNEHINGHRFRTTRPSTPMATFLLIWANLQTSVVRSKSTLTVQIPPWENKVPFSIIKMIDAFIR